LEWVGHAANGVHAYQHGLRQPRRVLGEANPTHKLTLAAVRFIRASDLSCRELAARFGVKRRTVQAARSRQNWAWVT
jgi:hypothetical protein